MGCRAGSGGAEELELGEGFGGGDRTHWCLSCRGEGRPAGPVTLEYLRQCLSLGWGESRAGVGVDLGR